MLIVIDRHGEKIVQKVITPKGKVLGYQAGIPGQGMIRVLTLGEARELIGKALVHPVVETKPKKANPQNQDGYRADRRS